jgi:hypothetical protein
MNSKKWRPETPACAQFLSVESFVHLATVGQFVWWTFVREPVCQR